MNISDLQPGLLAMDGADMVKVSTIRKGTVTAELVLPVPERTTVRTFTAEGVFRWRLVTAEEYDAYAKAYHRDTII